MIAARDLSWWRIADWFEGKTCNEHRWFGSCRCLSGRRGHKRNPCDRTQGVVDACKAIAMGVSPAIDLEEIITRAGHHRCTNRHCHHKGCVETDVVLNWLYEAKMKKAA